MGKVEKIVVLGVLFIIVSILALSLDGGIGGTDAPEMNSAAKAGSGTPLATGAGADTRTARQDRGRRIPSTTGDTDPLPATPQGPGQSTASPEQPTSLLSAQIQPASFRRPTSETPQPPPADWDLVTLAGLEDHSFDPGVKLYTAAPGDTFGTLSQQFYGDSLHIELLRYNNEGTRTVQAGQVLLIPVIGEASEGDQVYEVSAGESLWKIAKRVYGKGHLWERIYEANRDVLKSPDDVGEGLVLRIPPLQ